MNTINTFQIEKENKEKQNQYKNVIMLLLLSYR